MINKLFLFLTLLLFTQAQEEYVIFESDSTGYFFIIDKCKNIVEKGVHVYYNLDCTDTEYAEINYNWKIMHNELIKLLIFTIENDLKESIDFSGI